MTASTDRTHAGAGLTACDVESTIPERLAIVAREHAERVAILDGSQETTYAELWRRSAGVAHALLDLGVAPDLPVPVLADQGPSAVVALLGVSLAGAAFAPLDVLDPPARARSLVGTVRGRVLVTTSARLEDATEIASGTGSRLRLVDVDGVPPADEVRGPETSPDAPATVFFTSGSTGTPKGVVDVHRNVLHNAYRYTSLLGISPDDRLSVVQRPSFSGIASSVFGALLNGATLCPFPLAAENIDALAAWARRSRVTVFHSVPAIFRVLTARGESFPDVRVVRLEGDRATWDDVERFRRCFRPGAILANGLGTTETGLASQLRVSHDTPLGSGVLPVGRPAPDMETVVLSPDRRRLRQGAVGEIAVQSRYLARGYLDSPSATGERFFADPGGGDRRLYLTGDLGRIDESGDLVVLGRRDGSAKVGGARVEPAEVEAAILSLDVVRDARVAVVPARSGGGALSALVVPTAKTTAEEIRTELARSLPAHMIPAKIELTHELATDGNWKVRSTDRSSRAPRTALEAALTAIWSEILETEVGVDDPFVELGGDSLAAAEVAAAIESRLGVAPPRGLFARTDTVAELATALEARHRTADVRVVTLTGGGGGAPLVLVPDHHGDPLMFADLARGLGPDHTVWGVALTPSPGDDPALPAVADRVVAALREARPAGPYRICGFCYGALLTIEVTRRLRDAGEDVCAILLGLLPTDLRTVVSPDALERWQAAFGRTALGPTRMRYHVRRARRRSGSEVAAYVATTARRGAAYYAARLRPAARSTLGRAADGYHPPGLPGRVHVVLAEETVVEYTSDPHAAWARLADEVDARLVPGAWTDSRLLRAPASACLAAELAAVLRAEPPLA